MGEKTEEAISMVDVNARENNQHADEAKGEASYYHNEAADYGRAGDLRQAFLIVNEGLSFYPYNMDLLADALCYSAGKNCDSFLDRMIEIGSEHWNWRAFVFAVDYLIDNVANCEPDPNRRKKALANAVEFAEEYISAFPYDERAYVAKVKALEAAQGKDGRIRAKQLLHDLILGNEDNPDSRKKIPLVQCCIRYGDMLMECGEYETVPHVMEMGIAGSAQEQPSGDIGYLFYLKALAEDAQFQLDFSAKPYRDGENKTFETRARAILADYSTADKLFGSGRFAFSRVIQQRSIVLQHCLDILSKSYLKTDFSNRIEESTPIQLLSRLCDDSNSEKDLSLSPQDSRQMDG